MSNQYFNFYYDPVRQGFDPLAWRALYGTPALSGTRLSVNNSTVIHLADLLRGDISFNINIPAPAVGDDRQIGLIQYNKNAYIYFNILDNVLTAETSDGVTAYSTAITWQSAWSSANTEFRIKWEAGLAKFYIGGVHQVTISNSNLLNIPVSVVPGDPLSFYLSDYGSASPILLNYIDAKEIQSYILQTSNSSVINSDQIEELDRLNITEAVTIATGALTQSGLIDSLSTTENIDIVVVEKFVSGAVDELTITEDTTISIIDITLSVNVSDSLSITEDITQAIV